ncbi:cobalamin biosynthesis protein [Defluviimonas sp. SAOS-178_SWC]|uniref:cobalamin biosynthesis protein n=1 Tax=Defluviimonas sp. SAOS-178_SWC TaxID=3121287 RepID=UPI003221B550
MIRVLGIGCRGGATEAALRDAAEKALSRAPGAVDRLATLKERAETAAVLGFSASEGLEVVALDEAALRGCPTTTRSARIKARFGTGSVAEAAALVAAGPGARLCCARQISTDGTVTAAIAEGDG